MSMNYDLNELLEYAQLLAPDGKAEEVAGVALALAAVHSAVEKALGPLKNLLRDHARAVLPLGESEGVVEVPGVYRRGASWITAGAVTVTFPSKKVKVSPRTDIDQVKSQLGGAFSEYFEERTTVYARSELTYRVQERITEAPEEVHVVMASIDFVEPTPRVNFRPTEDVLPGGES